jgi:cytochrome c biogenesis protein CcmG, thiol:disulfide interchange protein DsbE
MEAFRAVRAAMVAVLFCLSLAAWPPFRAVAMGHEPQALDLGEYRGSVVVVDFWASWCVPCRRSFPWLDEMQQKYADSGLVVVGVNEDDVAVDADEFLRAFPGSFRIVRDPDGELARQFDLVAMPSTYVIGRNGEIAARHLGFKTGKKGEYEATLRRLLDGGGEDSTATD